MPPSNLKTTNSDIASALIEQAKVRTGLGVPVCVLMLVATWHLDAPLGQHRLLQLLAMAAVYFAYNLGSFIAANKGLLRPEYAVIATAILDPLMLSAWLLLIQGSAPLFIGFYLFTILGFGFRIGTQAMWIAQASSLAGFLTVIALSKFWQGNLTLSGSVLILLVAVPLYATILIKKLLDARTLAEFESQAKSQLLANVSHELRTPLNGIVATAQLLKIANHHPESVAHSKTILELSNDLVREINDLLDSAKYHTQEIKVVTTPVNLRSIAERLQMTLSANAVAKHIHLKTEVDSKIVDAVRTDGQYLMRALMNIAGNAVKFTDKGTVHVQISLLDASEHTYKVRFAVHDTGIGIPLVEQSRIFEPFYRAPSVSHNETPGTGLGLNIAHNIVTALGGKLTLQSQPGKGSLFYFDLLLARESETKESLEEPLVDAAVRGKKILAVEDHPVNCMLLKKILEVDSHVVTLASTGEEALIRLKENEFDLIILDFNLGDMDGMAVMQHYHAMTQSPAPIYFLTADATNATAERLKQAGAADILHKPLSLESLRRAIAHGSNVDAILS